MDISGASSRCAGYEAEQGHRRGKLPSASRRSQLIAQSPENGRLQKKSYDIDSKDFFWAKNAGNPFPHVAEDIDSELSRYKTDAAEITRSTGISDVNDVSQM
jgi:hypothetical protein